MELPHIGKHCKKEYCNKLDFLPIVCDSCKEIFCCEHFSYLQHDCPLANQRDNQVPVCPICMKPVPALKGQEDISVSEHIDKFCKQETRIYTNQCSFRKNDTQCKKRELVPFLCTSCKLNFCLKHRHFDVHNCTKQGPTSQRDVLAQAALRRANQGQDNFKKVQGSMSEDEALARALAASMQGTSQPTITVGDGGASAEDKSKCAIS